MKKRIKSSKNLPLSLFFTFLKQNDAYRPFMRNCFGSKAFTPSFDLRTTDPKYYLSGAFPWTSTPEGSRFWYILDDEWNLILHLFNF